MAISDLDNLSTDINETNAQNGDLDTVIQVIMQSRLDADQYIAIDLDGATESLAGSGNLSYAALQASQTNEAIQGLANSAAGSDMDIGTWLSTQTSSFNNINPLLDGGDNLLNGRAGRAPDFRNFDHGSIVDTSSGSQEALSGGGFTASTIGSVAASQLSSDLGNFVTSVSGLSLGSGLDGLNGDSGTNASVKEATNGTNGMNGANGTNGANGNDGNGDGGDTNIINIGDTLIDIDILDLGDAGDIINNVLINLNTTVTNITDFLTEIINVLGDVITNITDNLTNIIDLDFLTEIVTNITDNLTNIVNNTITEITNITNSLTTIINNLLGGGNGFDGLHLTLDLNVLDTLIAGVDIPLYDILATDLDLDINLTPTLDLLGNVGDLTGIDLINTALDQLSGTTTELQNTIDGLTDIVTNLDLKDIAGSLEDVQAALGNLDELVEVVLGDLTGLVTGGLETLGLGNTPLDSIVDEITENVLDPVLAGLGDVLEGNLPDALEGGLEDIVDNTLGGIEDLVDNLGLEGLGLGEGNENGLISQTLDPVIGDVGNVLDDLTGGASGELTETLEDTVDQVTDTLDVLTGGLTGGLLGLNNNNQNGADDDLIVDLGLGAPGEELINETIDVALDPVEDLIGDIDIGAALGLDLLGQDSENINNNNGDTDITLHTGIDIVDNTLLAEAISDIPLDPVESILGDVDLDIGASINLLGDLADPFVNTGEGGSGEDTLLANLGETLEDITSGILNGDLDLQGDSLGNVTETLNTVTDNLPLEYALTGALDAVGELGLDGLGLDLGKNDESELISQTLDPVLSDSGDILDDITGGLSNDLTDTLDNTVDQITDTLDALTGGITADLAGLNNNNQNGADGDLDVGLGLELLDETLVNDLPLEIALDPVEDLLGDVDIGVDLGLDLLGHNGEVTDNASGDSDITLTTGIELVDNIILPEQNLEIPLDPVEAIVGDIDLDLGVATNLLGDMAGDIVNIGQGGSGEDTLLANLGETLEDVTSGILDGDLDGDLGGTLELDNTIDTLLNGSSPIDFGLEDGLEETLGLLDGALPSDGFLGDLDGSLSGDGVLGEALDNWTESILPDSGGLFDDLTGVLGNAGDVLPDPVGTIAEGIGAIEIIPKINIGKLGGGLFG
jgi:hypothetical protein